MKTNTFVLLGILICIFGISCTTPTDSDVKIERPKLELSAEEYTTQKYEYILSDTSIFLLVPQCHCNDDSLHTNDYVKKYHTTINKDSLSILYHMLPIQNVNVEYSYLYRYKKIYGQTRNEFRGIWKLDTIEIYPTDSSKKLPENDLNKFYNFVVSSAIEYIEATIPGHMTLYFKKKSNSSLREYVIDYINSAEKDQYSIEIDSISPFTVRIVGMFSGDTVLISKDAHGNTHYLSSIRDPLSISDSVTFYRHTFFATPDSCPNPLAPDWFRNKFLDYNHVDFSKRIEFIQEYLMEWINSTAGSFYSLTIENISNDTIVIVGDITSDSIKIWQNSKGYVFFNDVRGKFESYNYLPIGKNSTATTIKYPDWFKSKIMIGNKN